MFLKKRMVNNSYYWSLAESYREYGKVKQRIILSLGNTEKAYKTLTANKNYSKFIKDINPFVNHKSNLIWFGGKSKLAKNIIEFFPKHKTFVDVFGGGANILIQKKRALVDIYNDINGDVVNYFNILREQTERFYNEVESLPYSREIYEQWRKEPFPEEPFYRAVRWFYINRSGMCGAGKGKTGGWRHGVQHNTVGSYRGACNLIKPLADRLKNVMIESKDFREILIKYDHEDTFFYIDPPYVGRESKYDGNFTIEDHKDLASIVKNIKGKCLISYYADDLVSSLYTWFNIYEIKSKVYSKKVEQGENKPDSIELLICNY